MKTPATDSLVHKKIEEFGEVAERIRIKYNPPRELFTIAVPVAVALLVGTDCIPDGVYPAHYRKAAGDYHEFQGAGAASIPDTDECRKR